MENPSNNNSPTSPDAFRAQNKSVETVSQPEEVVATVALDPEDTIETPTPTAERIININIFNGNSDELIKVIASHAEEFTDDDIINDPTSAPVILSNILNSALHAPHADSNNKLFDSENNFHVSKCSTTSGGNFGQNLKGNTAVMAFTAKLKGLKKVYLYNSGFFIVIKPLSMAELNQFFASVDIEDNDLGRLIGHARFTIHGAFIKRKLMELLPNCVMSSNLKGYRNSGVLTDNISFNDYDTILWALCSMMYKEPLNLNINCFEEGCGAITEMSYAIDKMFILNDTVLNQEALDFIHSDVDDLSSTTLTRYRTEILNGKTTIEYEGVTYDIQVPTMGEYLEECSTTIKTIIKSMQGENSVKNRELRNTAIIEFNRNYIPWITTLSMGEDEGKISTNDKHVYGELLRELGHGDDNVDFHDSFSAFMLNTQAVVVGYEAPACEVCGKKHDTVSGYSAWDFEKLFFDLTCQVLLRIGLTLN